MRRPDQHVYMVLRDSEKPHKPRFPCMCITRNTETASSAAIILYLFGHRTPQLTVSPN